MTNDRARQQAQYKLEHIKELMSRQCNSEEHEELWYEIHDTPVGIAVRANWTTTTCDLEASQYMVLLCTGGPAVRILGDLNEYKEPQSAEPQYQDWATQWTTLGLPPEDERTLKQFASEFYYG